MYHPQRKVLCTRSIHNQPLPTSWPLNRYTHKCAATVKSWFVESSCYRSVWTIWNWRQRDLCSSARGVVLQDVLLSRFALITLPNQYDYLEHSRQKYNESIHHKVHGAWPHLFSVPTRAGMFIFKSYIIEVNNAIFLNFTPKILLFIYRNFIFQ